MHQKIYGERPQPPPKITHTSFYRDFALVQSHVYDPCRMTYTSPLPEKEGATYGAATCTLNGHTLKLRTAKITPKKVGQFVTIWKRDTQGVTQPLNSSDAFDLLVIHTRQGPLLGQFIFPKDTLIQHGIISHGTQTGKRGIRVYPPWDKVHSKQAKRTQAWQLDFFLSIYVDAKNDLSRAKKLYGIDTHNHSSLIGKR